MEEETTISENSYDSEEKTSKKSSSIQVFLRIKPQLDNDIGSGSAKSESFFKRDILGRILS